MLRSREDGFSLARSSEGGKNVKSKDRLVVNLVSWARRRSFLSLRLHVADFSLSLPFFLSQMNELVRIHGLSGIGLEGSQVLLNLLNQSSDPLARANLVARLPPDLPSCRRVLHLRLGRHRLWIESRSIRRPRGSWSFQTNRCVPGS